MRKEIRKVAARGLLIAGGAVALLALTGCSSFSRQWNASVKSGVPSDDIAGPWEGKWISDVNGHNGRLRCVMTRKSQTEYDALFKATYKKVFSFSYTVPLKVERTGNSWKFSGEEDLGKLAGGMYSYLGTASASNFFSTYSSKYDHGKFEMDRPAK